MHHTLDKYRKCCLKIFHAMGKKPNKRKINPRKKLLIDADSRDLGLKPCEKLKYEMFGKSTTTLQYEI